MPGLYRTPEEKRELESRNGALQFLQVLALVEEWRPGVSTLTPEIIKDLQRRAIVNIYSCAGDFRDGPVSIKGVDHQPPHYNEVAKLVDDMCDYVNANATTKAASSPFGLCDVAHELDTPILWR